MDVKTEKVTTCLLGCDAPVEKLFDRPDWWFQLPGEFAWNRCCACGLYFLSPRPIQADIETYYPDSYVAYRPAIEDEKWRIMRWKRRRNQRSRVDSVTKYKQTGKLLEIGCATGNYLVEMRKNGWDVYGVELQTEAASYARNRFNLDVKTGDLLDVNYPDHYFDVVTLWDVIEHTYNPLAILKEVRRILKPGGIVVFSQPDVASKGAKQFGRTWIGYDSPRHLYLFAGNSLHMVLEQSGLNLLAQEYFLETYHTWVASLHTKLNSQLKNAFLRKTILKVAYLPFWSILTSPYFKWLNKKDRGTVVSIFAEAPEAE